MNKCLVCQKTLSKTSIHKRMGLKYHITCSRVCSKVYQRIQSYIMVRESRKRLKECIEDKQEVKVEGETK